jgi:cyclic pyranopterin phosphate synthase
LDTRQPFSHLNQEGRARMVDVTAKPSTARLAVARASVSMRRETLAAIKAGSLAKGDVLAVAQVAGVMAAKQTGQWIPMCHPLAITAADLLFRLDEVLCRVEIEARVRVHGPTGVEMEALTAVTAAALTIYDMAKSLDKGMTIHSAYLVRKEGGKSGIFHQVRAHISSVAGGEELPGAILLKLGTSVQLVPHGSDADPAAPAAWLDAQELAEMQPGTCLECGPLRLEVLYARERGWLAEVHQGGILRAGDQLEAVL